MERDQIYLFIQLRNSIDPLFLSLVTHFQQQGIILIPVRPEQIFKLFSSQSFLQSFLVCRSMADKKMADQSFYSDLKRLMQMRTIFLHHLSSFSGDSWKQSLGTTMTYKFSRLPISFEQLDRNVERERQRCKRLSKKVYLPYGPLTKDSILDS